MLPKNVVYVTIVHDGTHHAGENGAIYRMMRRAELRRADVVVALSSPSAEALSANGANVVESRHPAFEHRTETAPRKSPPPPATCRIGFVGRLTEYKGIDLLPEIARILISQGFTRGIEVYGDGPLKPDVDRMGQEILADTRWIPDDELNTIMSELDLIILPYTEASQSGVVALAMALGVPCIVAPVGGLVEQVNESGCGLVAEAATSLAIADAAQRLLSDPARYADCSTAGIVAASGAFSWSRLRTDIDNAVSRICRTGVAE
ncbi:glycosyltransferase family 4 protein [Flavimobilis soli]|uniref:glycosyltransferase family 4 protein n=1 Tax=Flavimobilis soli TaxID=442709 RepID=UPI003CCB75DD